MLSVRILDAERSRAKYTNQLRLEFENDDLRSQLNQANVELSQGTKAARQLRIHLHDASKEVDRLQTIIKAPSHTFDGSHVCFSIIRVLQDPMKSVFL